MAPFHELLAQSEGDPNSRDCYLQKFRLYETLSKFYIVGRNKSKTLWRVLKIDRSEPTVLDIHEDSTMYSEAESSDLLRRIHEGNRSTGGLKFVTIFYGIVGFIKFLGPYYMLLITERSQIGAIGGHAIYAISKTRMIPVPNPIVRSNMALSKNENRYKKLLSTVDLTKDFFFSYSYDVMCSLQKNLCGGETSKVLYETIFVWNEFLTQEIRRHLQNTLWTVALVHGFFKQGKLSVSGREFTLTLIARRSRHYAGTRFLKRGVNEKGRVANDVETEQIVFEDSPSGCPSQISSVVQNRGSIPLFWSQECSPLNIRPDIILSRRDENYEATKLHFRNLVKRYGNPIIILNLIKMRERKPRESRLGKEFSLAVDTINRGLSGENRLQFHHWDLAKYHRSNGPNVLVHLGKVAEYAVKMTGFFHSQVTPELINEEFSQLHSEINCAADALPQNELDNNQENIRNLEMRLGKVDSNGNRLNRPSMLQKGVLRTNCIDGLDRTNVAQYAYGLAALRHQLHALGLIDFPSVDLGMPLTDDLMVFYEEMGDKLALQYGGSPAHSKIFSQIRGIWSGAIYSQAIVTTLQRYYSNAYMDADKQNAINIFLGYFQPQEGKPALWELDSDQYYSAGRRDLSIVDENRRLSISRSLSDGNIVCESETPTSATNVGANLPSSSTSGFSTCTSDIPYSRELFADMQRNKIGLFEDAYNYSNFVDGESSTGTSIEDESHERSAFINGMPPEKIGKKIVAELPHPGEHGSKNKGKKISETTLSGKGSNVPGELPNSFVNWVKCAETVWRRVDRV